MMFLMLHSLQPSHGAVNFILAQLYLGVYIRTAQVESMQDSTNFQIAKRVYLAIDDNATHAHQRVEDELKRIYRSAGLSKIAVYGPPSACITGLREVAAAGAQLIQLHLLFDDDEQMERLAAEVIPHLG